MAEYHNATAHVCRRLEHRRRCDTAIKVSIPRDRLKNWLFVPQTQSKSLAVNSAIFNRNFTLKEVRV
jgi:hypothetical protein